MADVPLHQADLTQVRDALPRLERLHRRPVVAAVDAMPGFSAATPYDRIIVLRAEATELARSSLSARTLAHDQKRSATS